MRCVNCGKLLGFNAEAVTCEAAKQARLIYDTTPGISIAKGHKSNELCIGCRGGTMKLFRGKAK